jgi:CRP-like cAMP-binding protein
MIDVADFYRYSLFGGFRPEDGLRIAPLFRLASYAAGETIIREGQANNDIYFLTGGTVRVLRGERLLIEFTEGDSFGEIEMLDTKPAAATIIAATDVSAARLDHRGLRELFHLDAKLYSIFMMNLARDLARRLRRMDELMCGPQRHE